MSVLYSPGSEPQNIKIKLGNFFDKLDSAYPDKVVRSLHKEHKKWGETLTKLYRELGYESGNALLEAYGYTVYVSDYKGGKSTAMSVEQLVVELKKRYKDGSSYYGLKDLFEANPDLAPFCKTAQNKSNELFGMTFAKYLVSEGILAEKEKKEKPVVIVEKKPKETSEEKLERIIGELKRRYPEGKELEPNVTRLIEANSDMALSTFKTLIQFVHNMPANEFLIQQKLLKPIKHISEEAYIKCEELLGTLREKYGGDKARLKHINAEYYLTRADKKFMVENCPKVYGLSYTKLLEREGLMLEEYRCPEGLREDVFLTTKLNGSLAKFRYNVDTTDIRRYLDLIHNNWSLTDMDGWPTHIPVMATPESTAARSDALKKSTPPYPQIVVISKEEGERKIIDFLERCAKYSAPEAIRECLNKLPRKTDGSVMLKRTAVIDWSGIAIEGYLHELVIMAKNDKEIEMFMRAKKCDLENLNRINKFQEEM